MNMTDKLRQVLPEAILASGGTAHAQIHITEDGQGVDIIGHINLKVLAARIARLAGIEDIAMVPMFNMGTWNGDRDAKPDGFIPFPMGGMEPLGQDAPRPGQPVLKLMREPQRSKPQLRVVTIDDPPPAA
jgi:hypothetical protein